MLGKAFFGEDGRVLAFPSKHRNKQLTLGDRGTSLHFWAKHTHAMRGACCLTFLNDNVRPGEIASF